MELSKFADREGFYGHIDVTTDGAGKVGAGRARDSSNLSEISGREWFILPGVEILNSGQGFVIIFLPRER